VPLGTCCEETTSVSGAARPLAVLDRHLTVDEALPGGARLVLNARGCGEG